MRDTLAVWTVGAAVTMALGMATPALAQTESSKLGFTNIAIESGISKMVADHHKNFPRWWMTGFNLVDIDADGKLDLFIASHMCGPAIVALSDGTGHFTHFGAPVPTDLTRIPWNGCPEIFGGWTQPPSEIDIPCDIDEDGKIDLQMRYRDGGAQWWMNRSTPGKVNFVATDMEAEQGRANAMVDFDRDGKVDWLHEQPFVVIERGDGKGRFEKTGILNVPGGTERTGYTTFPVDINNDGLVDLVLTRGGYNLPEGQTRIFLNSGKDYVDASADSGLPEKALMVRGVGDVNQDSYPDLLAYFTTLTNNPDVQNAQPQVWLNDGKGHFHQLQNAFAGMENATTAKRSGWGLAVMTDFDNDGIPDLLWNGRPNMWVLRGLGGGKFQYMNKTWGINDEATAAVDEGQCFGDITSDGMLDIVGLTNAGQLRKQLGVYRNDLPKKNYVNIRPIGAPGNRGAAGAKIWVRVATEKPLEDNDHGAPNKLLWYEQVVNMDSQSAHSYYSYGTTERHYGLGDRKSMDVTVQFYPSGKRVTKSGVEANSTVEIPEQ